jgi:uncharacterized protein (DUF1778 family)
MPIEANVIRDVIRQRAFCLARRGISVLSGRGAPATSRSSTVSFVEEPHRPRIPFDPIRQIAVHYIGREIRTPSAKQARIEARVSPKQKRLFERAAALEGITLTDFAISSMQRAATNALRDHARIELNERSQRTFVEALLNPPEPNQALREAAKAYSKTTK